MALVKRRELLAAAMAMAMAAARGELRCQDGARAGNALATRFEIACMTLPYGAFPLERALQGIQGSGYRHVAWGVTHRDGTGRSREVLALKAPVAEARALGRRCRDLGLEPVMMFSTVNFEEAGAGDAYRQRVDQASEAGIPHIIVFGRTSGGGYAEAVGNLKKAAPHARAAGVNLLIKQHGGNTATGQDCSRIIAEVGESSVRMCYDAGNVLDYENHDPIPDIQACWRDVRAFAIKDHRNVPADEDCGPGFGEIDHYKLLLPAMRSGLTMPLACENIFEPLVPRPVAPDAVDRLARRAREYLESVLAGLERAVAAGH